jgi:hypothetical protein
VRLDEPIAREFFNIREELLRLVASDPVLHTPFDEARPHLLHHVSLLLPHGNAQNIRLRKAEPSERARHHQQLILIDGQPVRLFQDGLKIGMGVGDGLAPVLALDVVVGHAAL